MLKRVANLIVVAGPSCCGKSVFLQKLATGELPELQSRLGLDEFHSWLTIAANNVPNVSAESVDRMILHYALPCLQSYEHRFVGYETDPQLSALRAAGNISFVTLYTDAATLSKRAGKRLLSWRLNIPKLLSNPSEHRRRSRYLARLRSLYSKPENFYPTYAQWFEFCRSFGTERAWIVDATTSYASRPALEWEAAAEIVDYSGGSQ